MSRLVYVVRPLQNWPGELTRARRNSAFRSEWESTQNLLADELDKLGAKAECIVQLAVSSADIRINGTVQAGAVFKHPGVILNFESKHGPLQYASDQYHAWKDNVRAIACTLEALRAVERWGVTKRGEQYRGWAALEGPASMMTLAQARRVIDKHGAGDIREALRATHC